MTRSTFGAAAAALLTACALTLTACGGSGRAADDDPYGLQEPGTIVAAVSTDQPPFASAGKDGTPVGFIVDLTDEVARRLHVKVEYKATTVPGALQGLSSGQYDLAASGLGVTPERERTVAFTKGLYWSSTDVLVTKDNGTDTLAGFKGKHVGAVTGAVQESFVKDRMPGAELTSFQSQSAAVSDLLSGGLDAFVVGGPDADAYRKQYQDLKVAVSAPVDHATAMAVKKSNTRLQRAVDRQIAAMVADGSFLRTYDKWFSEAPAPQLVRIWPGLAHRAAR